jgi:hypothetical protein
MKPLFLVLFKIALAALVLVAVIAVLTMFFVIPGIFIQLLWGAFVIIAAYLIVMALPII